MGLGWARMSKGESVVVPGLCWATEKGGVASDDGMSQCHPWGCI